MVFGQLAVMVFFMLSGFVIYLATASKPDSFRPGEFVRKRALRIVPPYLCALFLSWVGVCISRAKIVGPQFMQLLGNVAFFVTEDPKRVHGVNAYMGNSPLWSLSFEVWFYVIFLVMFAFGRKNLSALRYVAWAVSAIGLITMAIEPNPLSLYATFFVVWWAGAEMAREYMASGRITIKGQVPAFGSIVAVGLGWALIVLPSIRQLKHLISADVYPLQQEKQLVIAVVALVVGLVWNEMRSPGYDATVGRFEPLSPISYGIYVMHYPLVLIAVKSTHAFNSYADLVWAIPAVLLLAYLFDYRLYKTLNDWSRKRSGSVMPPGAA